MAVSYGLSGLQVGFPSQNSGHLVDDWMFWLCDAKFCHVSSAQLQSEYYLLYVLGGTVVGPVVVD